MGWKDWPYWLKGGVIVLGFYIIATLILLPFEETSGGQPNFPLWAVPSLLPYFVLGEIFGEMRISPFIVSPIFYFILGALIGFVIDKIKNKYS